MSANANVSDHKYLDEVIASIIKTTLTCSEVEAQQRLGALIALGKDIVGEHCTPLTCLEAGLSALMENGVCALVGKEFFENERSLYCALLARQEAIEGNIEAAYMAALKAIPPAALSNALYTTTEHDGSYRRERHRRYWNLLLLKAHVLLKWRRTHRHLRYLSVYGVAKALAPEFTKDAKGDIGLSPRNAARTIKKWILDYKESVQSHAQSNQIGTTHMQLTHVQDVPPSKRLLRLPAVLARVGLSKSEWYRQMARGRAPAPVPIGVRARAWLEDEIEAYIKTIAATRAMQTEQGSSITLS